jgi:protein-L-isoaspartate(D-aspartate) O-methyltransferase
MQEEHYDTLRRRMVAEQLWHRGIRDQRVLEAMRVVPRHLFVPGAWRAQAYEDMPLPIGHQQTISQPYIVALMLEALQLTGRERVLEVGAGSGYQAALLGWLARHVYTVEIVPELVQSARQLLSQLGYENVEVVAANGSLGWKAGAPYDAIIVAAASPVVPHSLVEQLQEGGRLVLPVGEFFSQVLLRVRKRRGEIVTENLGDCAFVPLVGEEGWKSGTFPA